MSKTAGCSSCAEPAASGFDPLLVSAQTGEARTAKNPTSAVQRVIRDSPRRAIARSTFSEIQAAPLFARGQEVVRNQAIEKGAAGQHRRPAISRRFGARYRFWRGAAGAGVPVVAGASSGIQVIALRSYLNPLALLSASFVEFMTRYHLLLSLVVVRTELKGTATSFSPMPRKPPTPTMSAGILPSRSTSTSMISPILLSAGS